MTVPANETSMACSGGFLASHAAVWWGKLIHRFNRPLLSYHYPFFYFKLLRINYPIKIYRLSYHYPYYPISNYIKHPYSYGLKPPSPKSWGAHAQPGDLRHLEAKIFGKFVGELGSKKWWFHQLKCGFNLYEWDFHQLKWGFHHSDWTN